MLVTKFKDLEVGERADLQVWASLNDLWKTIYIGKDNEAKKMLADLVKISQTKKDPQLTKALLEVAKKMKQCTSKDKLLWSTSKVGDWVYPPIKVEDALPMQWNSDEENHIGFGNSSRLLQRYPDVKPLEINENAYSIEQNPDLNNCSLIASLINIDRFGPEHLPKIRKIDSNKYFINICFNGSLNRLVTVDCNGVPYNKETSKQLSLFSSDIRHKVIERAYLQLHGHSYTTSGSNVVVDTYRITGFVPEIGKANKYSFDKLRDFFDSKLCFLAIGTGNDQDKLRSPFLKSHDYSVIDFDSESREIIIQDPLNCKSVIRVKEEELNNQFAQLYINWDSSKLFKNQNSLTFYYDTTKYNKFESNFDKPIFSVTNHSLVDETVWILLETHLTPGYIKENSVAYLESLPGNISDTMFVPTDSASNIGLQLIKLGISKGATKNFLCYSNLSKRFTIHYYSLSDSIKMKMLDKSQFYQSIEFMSINQDMNWNYNDSQYFRNPTFQLNINSNEDKEVMINLQLLSRLVYAPLNFQVFDKDDIYNTKPIMFDNYYHSQHYERNKIPLETNHNYIVVCSCSMNDNEMNEFKLVGSLVDNNVALNPNLVLQRVEMTFGELLHRQEMSFQFTSQNGPRVKYRLSNVESHTKNNTLFIRLVSVNDEGSYHKNLSLKFRLNIYDSNTLNPLYYSEEYRHNCVIVPDFRFSHTSTPMLLIEIDGLSKDSIIPMKLYIGSKKEIFIEREERKK